MSSNTSTADRPTAAPAPVPPALGTPEWIMPPRKGERCPYSTFGRTKIDELTVPCAENGFKPPVLSSTPGRRPGTKRSRRLIHLPSLMAFIRGGAPAPES